MNPRDEQQFSIPNISETDNDIREILQDAKSVEFNNVVRSTGANRQQIIDNAKKTELTPIEEYDLSKGQTLTN